MIRYRVKKQQNSSEFEWLTARETDLAPYLKRIRREFTGTCGLGDRKFWTNFVNSTSFSHILVCWSADRSRWDGFAVLQNNYGCKTVKGRVKCGKLAASYYVPLICAHKGSGVGTRMMHEIMRLARADGKAYLTLMALPYVLPFYTKLGFQPTTNADCSLPEDAVAVPTRKLNSPDDALENRAYRRFLLYAASKHLGNFDESECEGVDCLADGVYLMLCL